MNNLGKLLKTLELDVSRALVKYKSVVKHEDFVVLTVTTLCILACKLHKSVSTDVKVLHNFIDHVWNNTGNFSTVSVSKKIIN